MAKAKLEPGDRVSWRSSAGVIQGEVVEQATSRRRIKGHEVAASPENPEWIVRSDKTGALAAHKPEALKPRK